MAVYVLVFLALLIGSIGLLIASSQDIPNPLLAAIVMALFAGGILGLAREARRDLDGALTFIAVFLICVAICSGIYWFSAPHAGMKAQALTLASALIGLGAGAYTFSRQRAMDTPEFPNILATIVDTAGIFEEDGVQFGGFVKRTDGTHPQLIKLFLQNCFDGPRTVRVDFDAGGQNKYLRYHRQAVVPLAPAAVTCLSTPVISPAYQGQYSVYFRLSVEGNEGKRVRLRRAQAPSTRVTPAGTAALLAFGILATGGGVLFTIGPSPERLWYTQLAPPEVEEVWRPYTGG